MTRIVGVDVGGTFTDIVVVDGGSIAAHKVPTTTDQARGVVSAVADLEVDVFLHGTTVATNTLLEGKGARVALVTDQGYEDILEIGRQDRPSLYDSSVDRPSPLVPRDLRFGLGAEVDGVVGRLAAAAPDVVAVSLIESHLDPSREQHVAGVVGLHLGVPVVTSSTVSPEFREYERTATTVLSAYLTPSVGGYLAALDTGLRTPVRLVMTSAGGLIPFAEGANVASRLLLSGPAAGAVAAAALGHHHGHEMVLSFDMGGTSTDVARITRGELAVGLGHTVGGRVNRVPSVPIRTIGSGGGSIGWVDTGGALRVGPRSAGADPGPAAYGLGGSDPTVTDANLAAGHIPADLLLGGEVPLRVEPAMSALLRLGGLVGLDAMATAKGMLEVVDTHMEGALRAVSVEEGADPRRGVLVAFGGAGGLHATRLAGRLGMEKVLVPRLSGVFSALGLVLAPRRTDTARTVMIPEGDQRLGPFSRELEEEAFTGYREVFGADPEEVGLSADVRYVGQSHELEVAVPPAWGEVRNRFEEAHQTRFGFRRSAEPIEVVNLRVTARGPAPLRWEDLPAFEPVGEPLGRNGVWNRETLPPGFKVHGPATVVETNSATRLDEGEHLTVLDDGTLLVDTH